MRCFKAVLLFVVAVAPLFGGSCAFAADVDKTSSLFSNNYSFDDGLFENKTGKLDVLWNARVYGEGATLKSQSSEVGGVDFNIRSKYLLLDNLEARVFLRAKYEAGRSQSYFGDLEPSNGIFAREAAIRYMPFEFLDVKGGVIDQEWMDMPLLTSRQSFPGITADLHHSFNKAFVIGVNAQDLIPTSQTLSSQAMDREQTPSYYTQMAYARWKNSTLDVYQTFGHYTYEHLPSQVAWDSALYGNDKTFVNSVNDSSFRYDFNGLFAQSGLKYRASALWEPMVYYNVIKNLDAPDTYNDGEIIGAGSNFYTNDYLITVKGEYYFLESDAVPGYYNSWAYGHTNKQGAGGEVVLAFLKHKFRLRAQYYQYKPLNFDTYQQSQQYFYFGVETGYDKI